MDGLTAATGAMTSPSCSGFMRRVARPSRIRRAQALVDEPEQGGQIEWLLVGSARRMRLVMRSVTNNDLWPCARVVCKQSFVDTPRFGVDTPRFGHGMDAPDVRRNSVSSRARGS